MIVFFGSVGSTMYQAHGAGERVFQLTDNQHSDRKPQIHNGQVTWYRYDGDDYEIFLYNGSSVIQLTDNQYSEAYPQIHNGQVTWYRSDGIDFEVFLYNGVTVVQLTDNQYDDRDPQIHGGQVTCPLHDMVIDLETGLAVAPDEGQTPTFETRVVDGEIEIRLNRSTVAVA